MKKRLLLLFLLPLAASAAPSDEPRLYRLLNPGDFDTADIPAAPDYSDPSAWAARPETDDDADIALPELPGIDQQAAAAAVFYIHPTTWMGRGWNGPTDTEAYTTAVARGGTLIQASAFNACCAVYAPTYRQAHGRAFTHPTPDGDRAREIAYTDVSAAFDAFLIDIGDRPFLLVGHSQGAMLGTRLLSERIAGQPIEERLVAAWLIGGHIRTEDTGGIPTCQTQTQTGCLVAYNARGPNYEPGSLELSAERPEQIADRICVNPLTWQADGVRADFDDNPGAVFFDTKQPAVLPGFADAWCSAGSLVVTGHGDMQRDFMSRLLLRMLGPENYHPVEYQLYYVSIRDNAAARLTAWQDAQESAQPE